MRVLGLSRSVKAPVTTTSGGPSPSSAYGLRAPSAEWTAIIASRVESVPLRRYGVVGPIGTRPDGVSALQPVLRSPAAIPLIVIRRGRRREGSGSFPILHRDSRLIWRWLIGAR